MKCPEKNSEDWKNLVAFTGSESRAMYAYTLNGEEIPSLDKAKELLSDSVPKKEEYDKDKALNDYIGEHLKQTYPEITKFNNKEAFERFIQEKFKGDYIVANEAIGAAKGNAVWIDEDKAEQITEIHEFGHLYWDMLPEDNEEINDLKEKLLQVHDGKIDDVMNTIANFTYRKANNEYKKERIPIITRLLKQFWNWIKKLFGQKTTIDPVEKFSDMLWNNTMNIKDFKNKTDVIHYMLDSDPATQGATERGTEEHYIGVHDMINSLTGERLNPAKEYDKFKNEYLPIYQKYRDSLNEEKRKNYSIEKQMGLAYEKKDKLILATNDLIRRMFDHIFNDNLTKEVIQDLKDEFTLKGIEEISRLDKDGEIIYEHPVDLYAEHLTSFADELKAKFGNKVHIEFPIGSKNLKAAGIINLAIETDDKNLILFDYEIGENKLIKDNGELSKEYTEGYKLFKSPLGFKNSQQNKHKVKTSLYSGILKDMNMNVSAAYIVPITIDVPILSNDTPIDYDNIQLRIPKYNKEDENAKIVNVDKLINTKINEKSATGDITVKDRVVKLLSDYNNKFKSIQNSEQTRVRIANIASNPDIDTLTARDNVRYSNAFYKVISHSSNHQVKGSKVNYSDLEDLLGWGMYDFFDFYLEKGYPEHLLFGKRNEQGEYENETMPFEIGIVLKLTNLKYNDLKENSYVKKHSIIDDKGNILSIDYKNFNNTESILSLALQSLDSKKRNDIINNESKFPIDKNPDDYIEGIKQAYLICKYAMRNRDNKSISVINELAGERDGKTLDDIKNKLIDLNSTAVKPFVNVIQQTVTCHFLANLIRIEGVDNNIGLQIIAEHVYKIYMTASKESKIGYCRGKIDGSKQFWTVAQFGNETEGPQLMGIIQADALTDANRSTLLLAETAEDLRDKYKIENFERDKLLPYLEKKQVYRDIIYEWKKPSEFPQEGEEGYNPAALEFYNTQKPYYSKYVPESYNGKHIRIKTIPASKKETGRKFDRGGLSARAQGLFNRGYKLFQNSKYDFVDIGVKPDGSPKLLKDYKAEVDFLSRTMRNDISGEPMSDQEMLKLIKQIEGLEKEAKRKGDANPEKYFPKTANKKLINIGFNRPNIPSTNLLSTFLVDMQKSIFNHYMGSYQSAIDVFSSKGLLTGDCLDWFNKMSAYHLYNKYTHDKIAGLTDVLNFGGQMASIVRMQLSPEIWMYNIIQGQMLDIVRETKMWATGISRIIVPMGSDWKRLCMVMEHLGIANVTSDIRNFEGSFLQAIERTTFSGMEFGEQLNQFPLAAGYMKDEQWKWYMSDEFYELYEKHAGAIPPELDRGFSHVELRSIKNRLARIHGWYGAYNTYLFKLNKQVNFMTRMLGWLPASVIREVSPRDYVDMNKETRIGVAGAFKNAFHIVNWFFQDAVLGGHVKEDEYKKLIGYTDKDGNKIQGLYEKNSETSVIYYKLGILQRVLIETEGKGTYNPFSKKLTADQRKGLIEGIVKLLVMGSLLSWLNVPVDENDPSWKKIIRKGFQEFFGIRSLLNFFSYQNGQFQAVASSASISWYVGVLKLIMDANSYRDFYENTKDIMGDAIDENNPTYDKVYFSKGPSVFGSRLKIFKDLIQVIPFGSGIQDLNELRYKFLGEKDRDDIEKEHKAFAGIPKEKLKLIALIVGKTDEQVQAILWEYGMNKLPKQLQEKLKDAYNHDQGIETSRLLKNLNVDVYDEIKKRLKQIDKMEQYFKSTLDLKFYENNTKNELKKIAQPNKDFVNFMSESFKTNKLNSEVLDSIANKK